MEKTSEKCGSIEDRREEIHERIFAAAKAGERFHFMHSFDGTTSLLCRSTRDDHVVFTDEHITDEQGEPLAVFGIWDKFGVRCLNEEREKVLNYSIFGYK